MLSRRNLPWFVRVLTILLAMAAANAQAQTYTVTRTSYHTLYTDTAHADAHLCGYAAYRIQASAAVTDLWATIGNFAGGRITLSANDDGVYHVGAIPAGDYGMAFFYLCGDSVPPIGTIVPGQTHTLTLWNRDPSLPGATQVNASNWTLSLAHAHINAQSNKIDAITVTPPNPVVGGTFTIRVDGRTGTIGSDEHLIFTPAAHAGWLAGAFELESTYIDLPDTPGDTHIIIDDLAHTGLQVNSANTPYFALYTFRVNRPTAAPVETSPYVYIDSGVNLKHVDVSHLVYPEIPPVPNPATLTKSATPTLIVQGTATNVSFSIRIANSASQGIVLDQVRDVLPAGFSYVPGSASYGGSPLADPLVFERDPGNPLPEQNLVWIGSYPVPALGNRSLVFQASVPANIAVGTYDNCSVAFIDGTQIDLTADTTDNAPACARVTVIPQGPPGGAIVVQKNTVGGNGSFPFTASPTPLSNFTLNVTGGSGVQTFTQVPGGTYTIQEAVPAGWTLSNIACTITQAGSTATSFAYLGAAGGTNAFEPGDDRAVITLGTDAQVRCVFTDTRLSGLTIRKATEPAATGQSFNFTGTGTGIGNFTLTPPATPTQTFANLAAGTYVVSETVPTGWTLANIVCAITSAGSNTTSFAFSGAAGGTAAFEPGDTTVTVTLGAGDAAECRFDNVRNGRITLVKNTTGGDDSFGFDTNGSLGSAEVTITTSGGTGNAVAFASVAPGTYPISEIVPAAWTLASIACTSAGGSTYTYTGSAANGATPGVFDPGDITTTVFLAAGDDVTCTFANDRQALVTVRKQVVPFVSTSVVFDLLLAVNGANAQVVADDVPHDGSGTLAVPPNASVVASERFGSGTPVTGYSATWQCTGTATGTISGSGTATTAFNAPPGGDVVCTFRNERLATVMPIPTLSGAALVALLLAMLGMAAVALRRHRD